MRVQVYSEELTNEFSFVEKHVRETGKTYHGFRIWLRSAPELHSTSQDDDRSAVTLWFETQREAAAFLRRAAMIAEG